LPNSSGCQRQASSFDETVLVDLDLHVLKLSALKKEK
jgi:hypothetical protein